MAASRDSPYPPLELANRVCCLDHRGDPYAAYEQLGAETKAELLKLLPEDWTFEGKRMLDFGCGAGRTLRQFLSEAQSAEFWGSDIDGPSIAWLRGNLSPPLQATKNGVDPPIDLETGSIDLAWAVSVFTHLTDNSLPWLAELHRLLKPGGLLMATYMGALNSEVFTGEPWDEDRVGMNVLRPDQGWEDGGPVVMMSDWWVNEHWGRAFEIVLRAPVHGQTWALLRKRAVEITAAELARPSEDPREYAALRHNFVQVRRDREQALAEVRREYESSLSWRVTRPLREAARLARERRSRSPR